MNTRLIATFSYQAIYSGSFFIFAPFLVSLYGLSQYAAITFWLLLSTIFNFFDFGISQSLTRYVSSEKENYHIEHYFNLSNLALFLLLAFCAIITLILSQKYIFLDDEFNNKVLPSLVIALLIKVMTIMPKAYYTGKGQVLFFCYFLSVTSALRLVLPLLFNESIQTFFNLQILIGLFELAILYLKLIFDFKHNFFRINFKYIGEYKETILFAINLGWLSIFWIVFSATDRFIASIFLEPSEFAIYGTLAQCAIALTLVLNPIRQAFINKLVNSNSSPSIFIDVFRLISFISLFIAIFLMVNANNIGIYFFKETLNTRFVTILYLLVIYYFFSNINYLLYFAEYSKGEMFYQTRFNLFLSPIYFIGILLVSNYSFYYAPQFMVLFMIIYFHFFLEHGIKKTLGFSIIKKFYSFVFPCALVIGGFALLSNYVTVGLHLFVNLAVYTLFILIMSVILLKLKIIKNDF